MFNRIPSSLIHLTFLTISWPSLFMMIHINHQGASLRFRHLVSYIIIQLNHLLIILLKLVYWVGLLGNFRRLLNWLHITNALSWFHLANTWLTLNINRLLLYLWNLKRLPIDSKHLNRVYLLHFFPIECLQSLLLILFLLILYCTKEALVFLFGIWSVLLKCRCDWVSVFECYNYNKFKFKELMRHMSNLHCFSLVFFKLKKLYEIDSEDSNGLTITFLFS